MWCLCFFGGDVEEVQKPVPLFLRVPLILGSSLGGGGRHGQLVTGWSIAMGPLALTPYKHHN